ncbi:hypothetical protein BGZ50_008377 [Haplosporangium sp. Z 11]|nr:hypothetical protein BGZ50_008377 [Haplosporangium sp. Z 11]
MREPNFSFPNQNRAAICITSSIYDRRALDCTDYIPIINTLTNLAYLTGSTPTIREFITRDGGLERLVTILKNTKVNDRKNGLKWTLAFQCIVNIGVRGTEHIRKRVVQAGMVPVIVNVLESFFAVLQSVNDENEKRKLLRRAEAAQHQSQPMITDGGAGASQMTAPMPDEHAQQQQQQQGSGPDSSSNSSSSLSSSSAPTLTTTSTTASVMTNHPRTESVTQDGAHYSHTLHNNVPGASAPLRSGLPTNDTRSSPMDTGEVRPQQFFYREDDILHSLQLLAYLSKYPSLRSSFHTASGSNVFAIVEKFTHRTMHPLEIQYWAGVIMRNACRKDDTRQGIRQCAYTGCGKWETKPREFAKCRRCRKAKYCSKQCQSKAWNEGHRWWCIEKKADTMGVSSTFGTDLPPAPPPPPPPPADLQDQQEANPSLIENGGIPSMASGSAGARMIGGNEGGSSAGHSRTFIQHSETQIHVQRQQNLPASSSSQRQQQAPMHASPLMTAGRGTVSSSSQHGRQYQTSVQQPQQLQQQHHHPAHHHRQHNQHHQNPHQHQLLQRQTLVLPPQPLDSRPSQRESSQQLQQLQQEQPRRHHHHQQSSPSVPSYAQDHHRLQQMRAQQQPSSYPSGPLQHQQLRSVRSAIGPSRSMTHPHPITAPLMSSPRSQLTQHLGITPDSPTPEQLAQRFVQQVALHPGRHNELAQHLNAQFQQYFPSHHQAEAKRQFSFHAREHFARYQRQQELLRNGGQGPSFHNMNSRPSASAGSAATISASPSISGQGSDASKQGVPRRRSDLDSDDEDSTLEQDPHATSTSLSMPMLTQDLSTTMSLTSTELSGPLPPMASLATNGPMTHGGESDPARGPLRDFKIRKLMAREETSSQSGNSSTELNGQSASQHADEWSYSRQMAKDTTTTSDS